VRALIDTNVIVYARDPSDTGKRERARSVLRACARERLGVLSTQVLVETFDVLTRGALDENTRAAAGAEIGRLAALFPVLPTDAETVLLAAHCARKRGLRIFDALIWSVARRAGVPWVLTEDLTHRAEIEGVRFLDPFAEDFDLAEVRAT
jgi:predicted nucleic acid-binding protein